MSENLKHDASFIVRDILNITYYYFLLSLRKKHSVAFQRKKKK